ncbi:MAG: endolytic transglycosylase MltG [candidate division NC10 bacterium]|nr:endolytic transglycosylase MltG [candidate division NC10 bacterium]
MGTTWFFRLRALGPIFLALMLTVAGIRAYLQASAAPTGSLPGGPPRVVFIQPKTGVHDIAQALHEAGIIRSVWTFLTVAYLQGSITRLHAGEYEFSVGMPLMEVLRKLEAGRVITHQVTIPEGFDALDIAKLLASENLVDPERFLALVRDPALSEALGIEAPGLEGYLFPDTYRLTRGMAEEEILRVMVARFRRKLPAEVASLAQAVGLDLHGAITVASLIEREAHLARERTLVSAVFHNRLRRKMPLQSDPTAVYGIPDAARRITLADLQRKSPYNTYLMVGLPPGPIANPGLGSILAAVAPAKVNYLYFVSKNDGSHVFSRTLREHSRAVVIYQRGGKAAGS